MGIRCAILRMSPAIALGGRLRVSGFLTAHIDLSCPRLILAHMRLIVDAPMLSQCLELIRRVLELSMKRPAMKVRVATSIET